MANKKSAEKRVRQTARRTTRNIRVRSQVKSALRDARAASTAGNKETQALVTKAVSTLARAASKGVIHKRTVARKTSRLMKKAAALAAK